MVQTKSANQIKGGSLLLYQNSKRKSKTGGELTWPWVGNNHDPPLENNGLKRIKYNFYKVSFELNE
jgi:hypothetical protein